MHETTEAMGFMRSLFPLLHTNHPLGKVWATQFEWIRGKKFRILQENTEVMGFRRSLFHYYTQITPLENGGYTV